MKNKLILIIILLVLLIPFFSYAEEVCNQDDIKIESVVLEETKGNAEEMSSANNDNNKIYLNTKMKTIGDELVYKIKIKNISNKDYIFDKNSLSTEYLNYEISYEDNSNIVKAGENKIIYLQVKYSTKPEVDKLNNGIMKENYNLTFNLVKEEETLIEVLKEMVNPDTKDNIVLYLIVMIVTIILIILLSKYKKTKYITIILVAVISMPKIRAMCTYNLDINMNLEIDRKEAIFLPGRKVNSKMKKLANTDLDVDENIISIKHSPTEPSEVNKEEKNIVSLDSSPCPIYMWYEDNTIFWWSVDETPSLNENANGMFNNMKNLIDISGLDSFDTLETKNMSWIFSGSGITNLDYLEKWDVSNVTDLSFAFTYSPELKNMTGIEKWNVSNVKTMRQLFSSCIKLEEVDLSEWETPSLEDISNMFGMWDSEGQGTEGLLKRVTLSEKFDTSKVTSMMFFLANNNKIEDYSFLQYLDTSNAVSMYAMFQDNQINDLSYIEDWNTSNVENMSYMFYHNTVSTDLKPLKNWDVSNVEYMEGMFESNTALADLSGLQKWNVSNVKVMKNMFWYDSSLIDLSGLESWNVSNVESMENMFRQNKKLKNINALKNWNTVNLKNIRYIFIFDEKLVDIEGVENWDVSNVTDMSFAFAAASRIKKANLSKWHTPNLTNISYMFTSSDNLEEIDLSNFNTRNVTDFTRMFNVSTKLKHIYVGENWDISNNAGETGYVFGKSSSLPNYDSNKADRQDLKYAYVGEGGYLEFKDN